MSEEMNERAGDGFGGTDRATASRSFADLFDQSSVEDASNVLLLGPMRRSTDDQACTAVLGTEPLPERNLLFVSLTQSASERVQVLRDHLDEMPAAIRVVSDADDFASETVIGAHNGPTVTVNVVSDPSDLPRLGMTISRAASSWETERPMLVCFHSLTALLQYAEPRRVFRFIHLLQNRLDGRMHYHMDVDAHDEQTIATVRPLFDAVVEYDADGNVSITA